MSADWSAVQLQDVTEILDHQRRPVNSDERARRPGVVPYYGANGQQGWIDEPLFNEPLILMAEDGGFFEEFATRPIAYRIDGPAWVNNHAHIIRAAGANQSFLFWALVNRDIRPFIAGGTRSKLTQAELRVIELHLPPLPEQRKIAEVLDKLDEAIRKTEQIITKLKQVKQGLLHDLLTRGIDHNGELRDPERHPEQFKDSELGRIPKEWEAGRLSDVGSWTSGGTPSKLVPSYWGGPIPWVSPKDMKRFELDVTEDWVTEAGAAAGSRLVPADAVFVVVRGMILAHTFPVCLAQRTMAFNQDVKGIIPVSSVRGRYLGYWFLGNERQMLKLVTEATHGTKRIDLADLLSHPIALPELAEQNRILEALGTHEAVLLGEVETAKKLRLLKQGLMEDLLTGQVRVTPLLEASDTHPSG